LDFDLNRRSCALESGCGEAKGAMITAKLVKEAIAQALGDQLV